jgi:hypothetical protein
MSIALVRVAMAAGAVAESADATIQKVEYTERKEQDAVTSRITEPFRLYAKKSNHVQEGTNNSHV